MALPNLTPEERAAGLDKAARARQTRAAVRADLKAGKTTLAKVIAAADDDEALAKLKVVALLESLPGIGHAKARAAMDDIGIAQSRRIRGMGHVQRTALIERFS